MNPLHWTGLQWLGFTAAVLGIVGTAGWWSALLSPPNIAVMQSVILTLTGIINLLLGKTTN